MQGEEKAAYGRGGRGGPPPPLQRSAATGNGQLPELACCGRRTPARQNPGRLQAAAAVGGRLQSQRDQQQSAAVTGLAQCGPRQ